MQILVTGATGFVGGAVVRALGARGHRVRAAVRQVGHDLGVEQVVVGDVGPNTEWAAALAGVDCVVHLAGRAHVMREHGDGEAEFQRVNVSGTDRLARAARAAGVRRLVFISSIKVNGERTGAEPFRASDDPAPQDAYGRSKLAAELALRRVEGLETVIVRPPLIYGPGVKGNLERLCRLAQLGWPVPFGSIENQRDMIGLENLADLIACCVEHPAAAGQVFLASDGEPLSTPALFRTIAAGLGRQARLVRVPVAVLSVVARSCGLGAEVGRLTGSLKVDGSAARELLGWQPREDVTAGLERMARAWRATQP